MTYRFAQKLRLWMRRCHPSLLLVLLRTWLDWKFTHSDVWTWRQMSNSYWILEQEIDQSIDGSVDSPWDRISWSSHNRSTVDKYYAHTPLCHKPPKWRVAPTITAPPATTPSHWIFINSCSPNTVLTGVYLIASSFSLRSLMISDIASCKSARTAVAMAFSVYAITWVYVNEVHFARTSLDMQALKRLFIETRNKHAK